MSRRQVVINPASYGISRENIFDNIKSIASNQLFECDIIVPNICSVNNTKSSFLEEALTTFPALIGFETFGKQDIGAVKFLEVANFKKNRIFFCNMYAEKFYKWRKINYFHLFNCMTQIRNICLDSKKKNDRIVKIHTRKDALGVNGKHGGRWTTIADFIGDCWNGIEVTIHE